MSDGQNENNMAVYKTKRFTNALERLAEGDQALIEDAIDSVIANPLIGDQKKGDLKHLRVFKTDIRETEYLIGYNWDSGRLTLHLLQLGTHENYYRDASRCRKTDLKLMKD
jgi:mRNA-degrading endonuclease RelE of RelBE toxin-antitoxin system